jgi:hypothetical protein
VNDPDGEVGYLLRFFPEAVELGRKIVDALKAEGIYCSIRGPDSGPDWHHYCYMYPVILKKPSAAGSSPFNDPRYGGRGGAVQHAHGDHPVADDLHYRCVALPLNQWYSDDDCRRVADGINKVLAAYCTPDADAVPWLPSGEEEGMRA